MEEEGEKFELKRLSREGLEAALRKAVRYRLLNEPREAESICRDVLAIEPGNQQAQITLILALTDQFGRESGPTAQDAQKLIDALESEYERIYYSAIICERQAKRLLRSAIPRAGSMTYSLLREAMELFEKAEKLRPAGNDEAVLRWNTCARIITQEAHVRPEPEDTFRPLLE
jgi:hypothetical protein